MHGEPALPPDFKHLPYANPDAPQGGQLRQAVTGSFDSVNPFIVKGTPAVNVRTYVFESLLGRNWDEPFSLYGLLAETIDVSDDRQTFTFKLRPEAKFSDGTPVTSADVAFSVETLRDKGRPNFKNALSKLAAVETPDPQTVIFRQAGADRELPLIVGVMPILSRAYLAGSHLRRDHARPHHGIGPLRHRRGQAGRSHHLPQEPRLLGQGPAHRQGPVELRRGPLRLLPRRQCRLRGLQEGRGRCPHRDRPDALGHGL